MTGWDVSRVLAVLTPVYNLLKGVPTDATLASAYWRKDTPVPAKPDPDRDGCGLLWCSPVVPSVGRDLEEVASVAQSTLLRHGFEPQMSVSLATDRSSICVITISYDRRVPGEDARAQACYEELSETLIAKGYPPYRLNVASMHLMSADGPYGDLLRRIKQAFDPAGICAPGRYEAVELTEDAALNSGAA
jgi:4-cresol dehydrogenase (hydroxylating)